MQSWRAVERSATPTERTLSLGGADLRTIHSGVVMPSFGKRFSDAELAAPSNCVIGRLGGQTGRVSPEQPRQDRSN